ncbi:MAG: Maf family protein, partial [Myxococcota bacterium]|nr:Maf family protein [Myxococcota bacterium]
DCAGSYMLEQGGIQLFSAMRGDDYTAIVGLPLTRVWDLLEANGYFGA